MEQIKKIILEITRLKLDKGKGGEQIKSAMSHFIKCASISKVKFSREHLLFMQEVLIVNATHTNVDIAVSAADALKYMHT